VYANSFGFGQSLWAESQVVGRYEAVTIGKAIEQRLKHA
jgi:hypothetical protein